MTSIEQKRKWRISKRLKLARASATPKLSQSELARRVQANGIGDFSGSLASRLELGYADATWAEVEAVAAALGVRADWLADVETPAPQPAGIQAAKPQAAAKPELPAISTPVAAPTPPPPPPASPPPAEPLLPLQVPPQANVSIYEYRTLLSGERRKADETMAKKGLSPAEWRRWRDYSVALTDTFRALQI